MTTGEIVTKSNLYELTQNYLAIKALVEQDEDFLEAFEQAEGDLIVKYENMGKITLLIKDDISELEGYKERLVIALNRINERIIQKENSIKRLMWRLQEHYRQVNIDKKLQYPLFDIQIEKVKPSVDITDASQVPASMMNVPLPPEPKPDKDRIYNHWKETGITVKGARILDKKYRLVIRSGKSIIATSEGYVEE